MGESILTPRQACPGALSLALLYKVPAGKQFVMSRIEAANVVSVSAAASVAHYRVALAPDGAADVPQHYIAWNAELNPSDNTPVRGCTGITLDADDEVRVWVDQASAIAFNLCGVEIDAAAAPASFLSVEEEGGAGVSAVARMIFDSVGFSVQSAAPGVARIVNTGGGGGGSVTSTELSNAVSVVSQAISAGDAGLSARVDSVNTFLSGISALSAGGVSTHGLQSVINALSNRISGVAGGAGSVTSTELSVVNARITSVNAFISGISALSVGFISTHGLQSVINALSGMISNNLSIALFNVNVASAQAASALSQERSVRSVGDADLSARVDSVNTFISGISALSAGGASTHGLQSVINALSNRISAVTGGAGSVTSTELSAVSAQAASALSQEISVRSAQAVSINDRISVVSTNLTSVQSTVSHLASIVSLVSATSGAGTAAGLQSVVNALSNRISALSASDVSINDRISVISGNVTSVQSTVSHLASIVSLVSAVSGAGTAVGLQSVVNALSNAISNALSVVSVVSAQAASAISQEISVRSAADLSINNRVSLISADVTSIQSTLSALKSAVSNVSATSAGGGSATGLQAVIDALSNKISTTGAGAASVTSAEYVSTLSDVSHLRSIVSNVSAQSAGGSATGLQNVINLLSNKISSVGGGGSTNVAGFVSVSNVLSGTTIVPISGLSVSVSAGATYKMECWIGYVRADTSTPTRFGFSLPPMKKAVVRVWHAVSTPAGQVSIPAAAGGQPAENVFRGVDSLNGSILVSQGASSITRLSTIVVFDAVLNVSATGVIQALWGGAAGKNVTIEGDRMSYIRVFKI